MPPHRAGQDSCLDVCTDLSQLGGCDRVIHTFDVLLDDRAFVKIGGDVVGGRAD